MADQIAELCRAELADLERLMPLVRAYHEFEGDPQTDCQRQHGLKPLLHNPTLGGIWLILSKGELAGYVAICYGYSIEFGGRDGYLDELFLLEEYRGHGLGKSALEQLVPVIRAEGVQAVYLEVAYSNSSATAFYRSLGFEDRSKFRLMSLRIGPQEENSGS